MHINPNLIPFPRHVIYGAVGHHDPPGPDNKTILEKANAFEEALGFLPKHIKKMKKKAGFMEKKEGGKGGEEGEEEEEEDDEEEEEGGEKGAGGGRSKVVPAWQIRADPLGLKKKPNDSFFRRQMDLMKMRGNFKREEKVSHPWSWRVIMPVFCALCFMSAIMIFFFLMLFFPGIFNQISDGASSGVDSAQNTVKSNT